MYGYNNFEYFFASENNETVFRLTNEGYSAIFESMEEPERHHVKWTKPDTGRQITHDLTYMRTLKT